MLSRRTLMALTAIAPIAPLPRLDIPDNHIEPLDVGRTSILAISPDASLLVGIESGDHLVFLDAATLEVRAESDPLDELRLVDRLSVRWSPDSARVAFSLDAWRMGRDSDIFIADVATATITNATPEGDEEEAPSLLDAGDVQIDMYPCWLDDTTLMFARNYVDSDGDRVVGFHTLDVQTGTTSPRELQGAGSYEYVASPIFSRTDGSFVTGVMGSGNASDIITVSADGESTPVPMDGVSDPILIDASDTHLLLWDAAAATVVMVPVDDPASAIPVADLFETTDQPVVAGFPCFGPYAVSLAAVVKYGEKMRLFLWTNGALRDCGYLTGVAADIQVQWAGDRILMAQRSDAWLFTLED